jgi:1-acyl-sn-glycerol-3-phosphate acyltransferase
MYPGQSRDGRGRMFVMNHRSGLDIGIVISTLEARILSRADLADWPVIGYVARQVGTVFVDRSSKRSGASAIKTMVRALKSGKAIALFPEGTAFAGDEVRPLKAGAFKVAQLAGAEIIPVGVAYADADASFGDESFGSHMTRVIGKRRVRVAVEMGEPIVPPHAPDLRTLADQTRQQLQLLVDRARARL